jgi:anti-sigma-K factor RskA
VTPNHDQFAEDLALYMLGELEPARTAEFRAHLEDCRVCQRELQQMQADTALYSLSALGPAPPARARERLLKALKAESAAAPVAQASQNSWWPKLAAAAFAAIAIFMFVENTNLQRTLRSYRLQNDGLQADLQRQQALWTAVSSPDAIHMTLTSVRKPEPQGRVVYLPKKGTVLFFANYFEPTPPKKTYQLWLVPANGDAPMPCGTFKPDRSGMASLSMEYMTPDVTAKSFAVTMEPEGGSQTPTMPILMAASARIPTE